MKNIIAFLLLVAALLAAIPAAAQECPLCDAATNSDIAEIKRLLANGENPNAVDNGGWTALIIAARGEHVEIVKLLLNNGANPNVKDNHERTILMNAARREHVEIVKALLANNANPNFVNKNEETALSYAISHNHAEIVKLLLDNGANPNTGSHDTSRNNKLFHVVFLYYDGKIKSFNPREIFHARLKDAKQGDANAQFSLGAMYSNGEGTIQNDYESYIWYSIAKANGAENAAESLRDSKLTPSEIKSARREAERRLAAIENKTYTEEKPAPAGEVATAQPPENNNAAEKVFENAWRSIVVVKSGESQGSGVIIRPNIVATNCHVVGGADIAVYKHDNRRASTDTIFSAAVRKRDDEKDFCLLDVASLWGIPAAVRKYDTLGVGEDVYALGSPGGLDLSLSTGVISQLRQDDTERLIQTDAAISPGSSGGGLFDSEGNLAGILTSKFVSEEVEGIGFAIPADLALDLQ
ncbi:MAG: ankyrin repeat domain-containing protein [Gammaproteobacteria bacterium]